MNYITDKHTYDTGYIALVDLQLPGLPDTIEYEGKSFTRKSELHLSIICVEKVAALVNATESEPVETRIIQEFLAFAGENALRQYTIKDEVWRIRKDERESLIVRCDMPELPIFFEELEKVFNCPLPAQPAHITLYADPVDQGIGLISEDQLQHLGEKIDLPEVGSAIQHVNN